MIKISHFSNHNSEIKGNGPLQLSLYSQNQPLSNVKQPANVSNKLNFEAEQKIETFKASLSQAPIMEAKQLCLQIVNDRPFLMENPEISSTVTLQKAGWFNEEIYF